MLPQIGSGAVTRAAPDGSGDSVDLGKLLGETLARLISEKRKGGGGPLLTPDDEGKVGREEFLEAVGSLGLSTAEARRIFDHFDRERTGFLSFVELHSELTTRITEKGRGAGRGRGSQRLQNSPFSGAVVGVRRNGSGKSRPSLQGGASSASLTSGGGIQKGLPLSRSMGSLVQPPSWDPVKGKLSVDSLKQAPLWRDAAVDGKNGSTSLMRALSSTGSLVRPSVKLMEEQQRQSTQNLQRHLSSRASVASSTTPLQARAEKFATKEGEKEGFIGKIHDEELVEQQLDAAYTRVKDNLHSTMLEAATPFNTQLERTLMIQQRVIEGRGNSLLSKANEVRAANFELRGEISRLRLERRLHLEFKEGMEARLQELGKLVPALVDQCNVLLFEGEKVQTKVNQTHSDAVASRMAQEEAISNTAEEVGRAEQAIVRTEAQVYENEQNLERNAYNTNKSRRAEIELSKTKLGYLKWKTTWWANEFERLKAATGLEIDFSDTARDGKVDLDTTPIENMMGRYAAQQADCGSLERFLDSTTQQVNRLDLELRRLSKERQAREKENDEMAKRRARMPSTSTKQLDAEAAQLNADCDAAEELLLSCFKPAKTVLGCLVGPADFAAAVREAEAARKRRYLEQGAKGGGGGSGGGFDRSSSSSPVPAPKPRAEEGGEGADDGEGGGEGDDGSQAAERRAARKSGERGGGGGGGPRILTSPSGILQAQLDELQLPHNSHRTRLLDTALVKVEHELLAVHDAVRNFRPILDYLAHPHKSSADRLPGTLLTWAGNPGDLEAKNVHSEFKRLAAEAEKKQREEAMREDAAAEEAKAGRRGGGGAGAGRPGGVSPSKSAAKMSDMGSPSPGGGLGSSLSMPALG